MIDVDEANDAFRSASWAEMDTVYAADFAAAATKTADFFAAKAARRSRARRARRARMAAARASARASATALADTSASGDRV